MAGALITGAALVELIVRCGGPAPPVDMMVRTIMSESGGRADAVNRNANGTADYGLAQINSTNLAWLGETPRTIMDPCHNVAAMARFLRSFSWYATGSPTRGFTLKPPGASVSYVEYKANPRFRDRTAKAPPAHKSRRAGARLISVATK